MSDSPTAFTTVHQEPGLLWQRNARRSKAAKPALARTVEIIGPSYANRNRAARTLAQQDTPASLPTWANDIP